jgi:YggT family protein
VITIIFQVLAEVLTIYFWIVVIAAIYQTLASFGVIDTRNRMVWTIGDFLYRATEPALRPIRRILPDLGGIDFSPWILCLLIRLAAIPLLARIYVLIETGDVRGLLL